MRDLVPKRFDQITEDRAIPGCQISFDGHAGNESLAFQLCHFGIIDGKPRGVVALTGPLVLAQVRLLNTNLSIAQIAYECGFSDSAHFIRRFKDRFDGSPALFRKRILPKEISNLSSGR